MTAIERLKSALRIADLYSVGVHFGEGGKGYLSFADLREALARIRELEAQQAAPKPTAGDLWWNPANGEVGFGHWSDAFEDANEDGEDYSVELCRARSLPPVWAALVWIEGEQKIKVFATKAEADEARAALSPPPTGEAL